MKLKKKKLNKDKSLFKRRGFSNIKNKKILKLRFGSHGLYFNQPTRVELVYLVMLRRVLKKFRFTRKIDSKHHRKFWFCLRRNYTISKKSKNARMGKGKGKFLRWSILVPRNSMLLEFAGWHMKLIKYVCYKLDKKAKIKLNIFLKKKPKFNTVMGHPNRTYYLINRYNCAS